MPVDAMVRHVWWTLRGRAAVALAIVSVQALALASRFGGLGAAVPADWELGTQDRVALEALAAVPYREYLRQTWAGGDLAVALALIAVALTVGGVAAERRRDTLDLTLSLPVPRSRWLLVRGAVVTVLLVLLGFASAAVVAIGGHGAGGVPGGLLIGVPFLAGIGAASGVALALLAGTVIRDAIPAALIALLALYLLGGGGDPGTSWAPGAWLDIRRWASPPWVSLATWGVLVAGAAGLAIHRFNRIDS